MLVHAMIAIIFMIAVQVSENTVGKQKTYWDFEPNLTSVCKIGQMCLNYTYCGRSEWDRQ